MDIGPTMNSVVEKSADGDQMMVGHCIPVRYKNQYRFIVRQAPRPDYEVRHGRSRSPHNQANRFLLNRINRTK
jgi:hypothetical protein